MDNRTTAELVECAKNGDEVAVEQLYSRYAGRIYTLCLRMACNRTGAEDLTQEIFLRTFRNLHTFRGDSTFSAWLYRLSSNVVLMKLPRKFRPQGSLAEITGRDGTDVPARLFSIPWADSARFLLVRLSVRQALDQLWEGFRRTAVLHDVHGCSSRVEIAKMAGGSVGRSKFQLHRARRRLRELLDAVIDSC